MSKVPTAHIEAKPGDFAKVVLMPGDPLRAKFIADNFLTDVKQVNGVRGMLGFTGFYEGVKVSIMGHGMGNPSIGIYSYELFAFYNVETIIRIGSCGSFIESVDLGSIIIGDTATSYSTYAKSMKIDLPNNIIEADKKLVDLTKLTAKNSNIAVNSGLILSSDCFYASTNGDEIDAWIKDGKVLAVEMEAFALYTNARKLNKSALTILTVSDSLVTHKEMTSEERQTGFKNMMKLSLEVAKTLEGK